MTILNRSNFFKLPMHKSMRYNTWFTAWSEYQFSDSSMYFKLHYMHTERLHISSFGLYNIQNELKLAFSPIWNFSKKCPPPFFFGRTLFVGRTHTEKKKGSPPSDGTLFPHTPQKTAIFFPLLSVPSNGIKRVWLQPGR